MVDDSGRYRNALERIVNYPRRRTSKSYILESAETECAWCGGVNDDRADHLPDCPAQIAADALND